MTDPTPPTGPLGTLDQLEEKVYRSRFDDGLADLLLGLYLVVLGLTLRSELSVLAIVAPVLFISLWPVLQKLVTVPRLGHVEFSAERKSKQARNKQQLVILFSFTLLAGIGAFFAFESGGDLGELTKDLGPIPFGVMLGLVVAVVSGLMRIWRGLAYGALIAAAFVAGHRLELAMPAYVVPVGAIITLAGAVLLFRFLRRYPVPPEARHA